MKWKLLALILFSFLAFGQTITTQYQFTTSSPAAGTTSGGGAANETNSGTQFRKITWTVTGTVATCSVQVDSSADNITYSPAGAIASQTCTSNGASTVATGVFNYTRINVTAISGGGSVKVVYQGFPTSPSGGGTVTSVSGTANQIDVSNPTTTPIVSLDPAIILPGSLTAPTGSLVSSSGTGQIRATSGAFPNATQSSPSPVATSTCPGNTSTWAQNGAGTYQTQFGTDPLVNLGGIFNTPGLLTVCRPIIFNPTGATPGYQLNGVWFNSHFNFDPTHVMGTQEEFFNVAPDSQTYTSNNLNEHYAEEQIFGTPTVNTTFVATYRARMDDFKTGGSKPHAWSVFQGATQKAGAYDITNCTFTFNGFTNAPCFSIFWGDTGPALSGTEDETGAVYDVFAGGTKDSSHHATNGVGNVFHALVQSSTSNRLDNTRGFNSEDFGTASGYYNFFSQGVNAAGTASGYNAFVGPTSLGTTTHPGSGAQLQIVGGALNIGGSTPSSLAGFSTTDDILGTVSSISSVQYGPTGSTQPAGALLLTAEPADGITSGQEFDTLLIANGTDATNTKNYSSLRGIYLGTFPQSSGTISNLFGMEIANQWNNSGAITNAAALRIQSGPSGASATGAVTTNAGINIFRTGFPVNPGSSTTITTDAGIIVGAPQTRANGVMTHHYGIVISGTHTGGTGNADGWAIFDNTASNKTQLGTLSTLASVQSPLYLTTTNCSSSGGTCAAAPAGSVSIAAAATTVTVATTAVTANSQIFIQEDSSLGTKLGVTCNTTIIRTYAVTARTAGTSFVITASAAPAVNPACLSYSIVN